MKKPGIRKTDFSLLLIFFAGIALFVNCTGNEKPGQPNIILILTDDHRYDAMGFMGHPFLKTPYLDRLAKEGVHFKNAVVTTSLCSPSRASILTGLYAHNHKVVDNYNPLSSDLVTFPKLLRRGGYETAFIGKWHMGETDEPREGFDYWLSFKGQGTYWPDGRGTTFGVPQVDVAGFNINGKSVPQKGYITDELTDYAIQWMQGRKNAGPFMLYISHKAAHADFVAADRHRGLFQSKMVPAPVTPDIPSKNVNKPMWVQNQKNSRHGVDYAYNLDDFDLDEYYQRYTETLLAVDENVGRIYEFLQNSDLLENTMIIYMGDNGFHFGEHGIIDKRTPYNVSLKVPLLVRYPKWFEKGLVIEEMVANIDIAPTLLDAADAEIPAAMDGKSFLPLMKGKNDPWRESLLYEYYWEHNYPFTPTTFALLTNRYKYIQYYGIWDIDELYDMGSDPEERNNLIFDSAYHDLADSLKNELTEMLMKTGGNQIPLLEERGKRFPWRKKEAAGQASFPEIFFTNPLVNK